MHYKEVKVVNSFDLNNDSQTNEIYLIQYPSAKADCSHICKCDENFEVEAIKLIWK